MVYMNDSACNGCEECVDVCPNGALIFQNNRAFTDQELCQGCEVCLDACPRGAILSGDRVPASQEIIYVSDVDHRQVTPQFEREEPETLRKVLLPAMGSLVLWMGREFVPRIADAALAYLDRRTQSSQTRSAQKFELVGDLFSRPTQQNSRRRHRRHQRRNRTRCEC